MLVYNKPPLTHPQQVDLLIKRGLSVPERERAESFLKRVNYYRLSAYCIPFEKQRHKFAANATFDDIQHLYEFDRQLRFLMDEALEMIEVNVRSVISYHLAHMHGSFCHENKDIFYFGFDFPLWINKMHEEILRSKETFVKHYRETYKGFPVIPIWMAVEVMSFGAVSTLYHNLLRNEQITISRALGLHSEVLSSWLHTFTYVRNICAHHSRLWNRELAIALKTPKNAEWNNVNTKRVFSVILAINHMLHSVSSETKIHAVWHAEMSGLLQSITDKVYFAKAMGIPENFTTHPLWNMKTTLI